jgi:Rrf2 family nitric oxide-sensitive transcriptional repressor
MIFSQTVEYALRAAVWLADHDGGQTTQEIAEATKVPSSYLSKVLQGLRRAGIVHGQRGVGGGFTLARPPGEISVLDVVQAVDPIERITTCPLGLAAHGVNLCPLHRKLDDAIGHVTHAFGSTTLAELVAPRHRLKPLCPGGAR